MNISNFSDVDNALKRICELEVALAEINGEITLKCNEIKDAFKPAVEKLDSEKKYVEQQISAFCEENKAEFAEKRSREFTFGKIGYMLSKSVSLPRIKEKVEKLIKALKSYKFDDCISYEETLNKEAICELGDADLVKLGLKRLVKDNFRIETKIENLQSANT